MMDIVYIVRAGNDNEELRYSLRSLQNVPHDNVWIIGFRPSWVSYNVKYVSCNPPKRQDIRHPKWVASWAKFRKLLEVSEISDDFIYFNDDFFVMAPIDEIPVQHRGLMDDILNHRKGKIEQSGKSLASNRFLWTMHETNELLKSLGKPSFCYELHTPMVFNKDKLREAMDLAESLKIREQQCINKRSFYGNYWELGGEKVKDVKVKSGTPSAYIDVDYDIDPSPFISTSDTIFNGSPVGRRIRNKFSQVSPYEKTYRNRRRNGYNYYWRS